jgi:HK97 family phage prohead protease
MDELKLKHFTGTIKAIDEQRRAVRFIISSDDIDRDNEIVTVEAVKNAIPAFGKNSVCLLNHQHRSDSGLPTIVGSWDTATYQAYKHHSEMDLIFADTELGETCWKLCKAGHMKAVSIGFRILDGYEEMKGGVRVYIITKIELYEISLVAVPANRRALAKSILKDCGFGDMADPETDEKGSLADGIKNHISTCFDSLKKELKSYLDDRIEEIKDLLPIPNADRDLSLLGDEENPSGGDAKQEDAEPTFSLETLRNALTSLLSKGQS